MMKKIIKLTVLSVLLFGLNGCIKLGPQVISKTDTVLIWSDNVENTRKVQGNAFVYFKNMTTNKEEYLYLADTNVYTHTLVTEPGEYEFTHWIYNSCSEGYRNGRCTKMHNFKGSSSPLRKNGRFKIKKGEIFYLGNIVLDSLRNTISIKNHYSEDIKKVRKSTPTLKNRRIKNYSKKLNIKNWKFNITGRKYFGFI